jgi:hypothetical protein
MGRGEAEHERLRREGERIGELQYGVKVMAVTGSSSG